MPTPLDTEAAARIGRHGSIGFDEIVDLALYDPVHGFYSSGVGQAGRRADFLTSPEVGPLFGAVIARALDLWWNQLGRPDPFTVVEAAAGSGMLARSILMAEPKCSSALTYVLVERSAALREQHREYLPILDGSLAFPPQDDESAGSQAEAAGRGPRCVSLPDLPAMAIVGVVLANELLDNLPFRVLERGPSGWLEVRAGIDPTSSIMNATLVEIVVPAIDSDAVQADRLVPDASVGARIPLQHEAAAWVASALDIIDQGRLVIIDYASPTEDLAMRPVGEWLRTYRNNQRGDSPLKALGTQDITCEVDATQLGSVRRPTVISSQAAFLTMHGMSDLVDQGRQIWNERAHLGDLLALRARSRIGESEALLDPAGLGGFTVFEWIK
ncbi:MAG: SAM-dependent methyltransferase [Actinomycetes bacterium]